MRTAKITAALLTSALGLSLLGVATASAALQIIPPGDPSGLGFSTTVTSTQAGAHPEASTSFNLTPLPSFAEFAQKSAPLKSTITDLPPGVIGNPEAVAKCTTAQLRAGSENDDCPAGSQVGVVDVRFQYAEFPEPLTGFVVALYNVEPPPGALADLVFKVQGTVVHLFASVRPGDHAIRLRAGNALQFLPVTGVTATVWGVPLDPSHDLQRCPQLDGNYGSVVDHLCEAPDYPIPLLAQRPNPGGPRLPFFTNPTVCDGPKITTLQVSSWYDAPDYPFSAPVSTEAPTPTGCDQLEFDPTIEAKPTTNVADSPSGLDFNLHVPQNEDPDGFATAHLKDATVTLPQGLTVNPSSANGLGACSEAQIAIGVDVPNSCPDASKLGTVQIDTPVLENPVPGEIFLAEQNANPFNSLIALYIAAKLPNGQEIKLPGKAETDPVTGQITTTFKNNPQLPFEDLNVNLFGGATASLRTPVSCGTFTTEADLVPWASPEVATAERSSSFQVTQGAGGGACVSSDNQAPNQPSFTAGTVNPTAGAFSPFVLKLARADGTQPIKGLEMTLPKGLTGKLAGIPYCPDAALAAAAGRSGKAEQASPSCPAASQVGTVNVSAGAGPAPLNVGANAYLSGPYKSAPLSMAIITPAVAGPFDLGVVVTRVALNVDPATAQIHAVSDPIPTILQGIPLDVRTISVDLAKPQFTLNPTSCDPMAITGSALSLYDQIAPLENRFQVGDCAKLGFKPQLALRLKGGTKRDDNPALTATLTYPKGAYANIASASVALPRSEFLDQAHIGTVCTRVQYAVDQCPARSVYGFARATTPLLDKPLEGPVYLRSSSNPLPDLVMALKGQIEVDFAGRIDSVKGGGIRTTFDAVPDAPVSKFTLMMQGGKKGLLENSRDICLRDYRATAKFTGQNGKTYESKPLLKNGACSKAKKKKRGKHKRG